MKCGGDGVEQMSQCLRKMFGSCSEDPCQVEAGGIVVTEQNIVGVKVDERKNIVVTEQILVGTREIKVTQEGDVFITNTYDGFTDKIGFQVSGVLNKDKVAEARTCIEMTEYINKK